MEIEKLSCSAGNEGCLCTKCLQRNKPFDTLGCASHWADCVSNTANTCNGASGPVNRCIWFIPDDIIVSDQDGKQIDNLLTGFLETLVNL